jgi:hypothetical protein
MATKKWIANAEPWINSISSGLGILNNTGFNYTGMIDDGLTLSDSEASSSDKVWAGVDLAFNVVVDVLTFVEIGEEIRIGEAAIKEGGHALAMECGGLSFKEQTLVATDHGEQAIETLHPGEQVWAYNQQTQQMELEPILHVWVNHDDDLVDLDLTSTTSAPPGKDVKQKAIHEVIHTNQKHPFLTVEKGFLLVGQITLGMHVRRADGSVGTVTGWKMVPGIMTMYNLEVAQDHTFTVGDGQWVVHNCGGKDISGTWHEGGFDSSQASADYHFIKHGFEVGASDVEQYIRKAQNFQTNLRGATKSWVKGSVEGVMRYKKLGKYIDIAPDGRIISFGKQ